MSDYWKSWEGQEESICKSWGEAENRALDALNPDTFARRFASAGYNPRVFGPPGKIDLSGVHIKRLTRSSDYWAVVMKRVKKKLRRYEANDQDLPPEVSAWIFSEIPFKKDTSSE